jgi:hypothetical protein
MRTRQPGETGFASKGLMGYGADTGPPYREMIIVIVRQVRPGKHERVLICWTLPETPIPDNEAILHTLFDWVLGVKPNQLSRSELATRVLRLDAAISGPLQ